MKLNVGDKIKLDIRKQGINGEGIGYYNKIAVFVPGAILKEKIFCEITFSQENYAVGKILTIDRVSKRRVDPPCKYYENCGGCHMQHIDYKEQLKIKQKIIVQALRKYTDLPKPDHLVKKTIGMENPYGYRNKSQMPFRNTNFGLALGFYKPESNHFVYVDNCIVHSEGVNKINAQVLKTLRKFNIKAYDNHNKDGILVYLVTRYLEKTDSGSITFVVSKFDKNLEFAAKDIMNNNKEIKSISYTINNRQSHLVISEELEILAGSRTIDYEFEDIKVKISPNAFHQLNSSQMETMYKLLVEIADLKADSIVFDLYSGIGITSMLFARHAKQVYGIDYSKASISDATENAKLNGFDNIKFIEGHVEGELPALIDKKIYPDVVLLDPPRKGLAESVINAILKTKPRQIVYISCNPSTLAKNIKNLLDKYEIDSIQPIDMFPNTASVESLTLLKLKKDSGEK